MTTAATEPALAPAATEVRPCDVHGCARLAVVALRFRDQPGHTHVCGPCAAVDREWCDVIESYPLPCPYDHGTGQTWVDRPRALT